MRRFMASILVCAGNEWAALYHLSRRPSVQPRLPLLLDLLRLLPKRLPDQFLGAAGCKDGAQKRRKNLLAVLRQGKAQKEVLFRRSANRVHLCRIERRVEQN